MKDEYKEQIFDIIMGLVIIFIFATFINVMISGF